MDAIGKRNNYKKYFIHLLKQKANAFISAKEEKRHERAYNSECFQIIS